MELDDKTIKGRSVVRLRCVMPHKGFAAFLETHQRPVKPLGDELYDERLVARLCVHATSHR